MTTQVSDSVKNFRDAVISVYKNGIYELNIMGRTSFETLRNVCSQLTRSTNVHNVGFSLDSKQMISYAQKAEFRDDPNRRTKTTLGRYIRKHLKIKVEDISDELLNRFVNLIFKGNISTEDNICLYQGNKILDVYNRAIGSDSCMTGICNEHKINLYTQEDKVAIVISMEQARALLWNTDDNVLILDRIYYGNRSAWDVMLRWANLNGIIYKDQLSSKDIFTVTLKYPTFSKFPYLDTFKYGRINMDSRGRNESVILSNAPFKNTKSYLFQQTDGSFSNACNFCGRESYGTYKNVEYCHECWHSRLLRCKLCGKTFFKTEIKNQPDINSGEQHNWYCESCLKCINFCDRCGRGYRTKSFIIHHMNGDTSELCSSCFEDNTCRCEDCGKHVMKYVIRSYGWSLLCSGCWQKRAIANTIVMNP